MDDEEKKRENELEKLQNEVGCTFTRDQIRHREPGPSWREATTLEATVHRLLDQGRSESEEFQSILRVFGREKIVGFYKSWKHKRGL